jgi:hypothetical protein
MCVKLTHSVTFFENYILALLLRSLKSLYHRPILTDHLILFIDWTTETVVAVVLWGKDSNTPWTRYQPGSLLDAHVLVTVGFKLRLWGYFVFGCVLVCGELAKPQCQYS